MNEKDFECLEITRISNAGYIEKHRYFVPSWTREKAIENELRPFGPETYTIMSIVNV